MPIAIWYNVLVPAFRVHEVTMMAAETTTIGKVLVAAQIENLQDLFDAERGLLPAERVRRVEVTDASRLDASNDLLA
jgi:hypothetical protein